MKKVFLALGGNIGDVSKTCDVAVKAISKTVGNVIKQSSLYKTEPWGNKKQEYFLNKILITETDLSAVEVLKKILHIEKDLGRSRNKDDQFAPRKIDIDILFYANEIINDDDLIVPHPRLHLRNFILTPLLEIAPDFIHPLLNKTIKQLFETSGDKSIVQKAE